MRILHTSDWHLGKQLLGIPRINEQKEVLDEICEIADSENIDLVLLAGDLFDTYNPPAEATEVFYKKLKKLTAGGKRIVVAIAGNHDSPERIEAPDPLALENGIIFTGYPNTIPGSLDLDNGIKVTKSAPGFLELTFPSIEYPVRIILTPYANEFRLKTFLGVEDKEARLEEALKNFWNEIADKHCDNSGVNLLITHLFMSKRGEKPPEEPEEEKPILQLGGAQIIHTDNIPSSIQYTALGHLHGRIKLGDDTKKAIYYSGSPLAYGFNENRDKYVIVAEIEPDGIYEIKEITLTKGKKLTRAKFENVNEALQWLGENQNSIVELTLVSEEFIRAEDRKRIFASHPNVFIIPEITGNISGGENSGDLINLDKSLTELFYDFFEYSSGKKPNDDIKNLFNEILSAEEE